MCLICWRIVLSFHGQQCSGAFSIPLALCLTSAEICSWMTKRFPRKCQEIFFWTAGHGTNSPKDCWGKHLQWELFMQLLLSMGQRKETNCSRVQRKLPQVYTKVRENLALLSCSWASAQLLIIGMTQAGSIEDLRWFYDVLNPENNTSPSTCACLRRILVFKVCSTNTVILVGWFTCCSGDLFEQRQFQLKPPGTVLHLP